MGQCHFEGLLGTIRMRGLDARICQVVLISGLIVDAGLTRRDAVYFSY